MAKRPDIPWLDIRDGVYYVFWTDRNGPTPRSRRRSLRTKDAEKAKYRYAAFLTEGGHIERPEAQGAITASVALDHYWAEHVKPKVIDQERIALMRRWLDAHFGPVPVSEIDIPMCRRYVELREKGVVGQPAGAATVRRELGTLVAAINHEVKWKRVLRNDVPHVELPAQPAPRDRWLTREELERLFAHANMERMRGPDGQFIDRYQAAVKMPRVYRFVLLAYYTAARKSAVLGLKREQVDLKAGLIYLNPTGRAQTKKRRPIVPIDNALRPHLERMLLHIAGDYLLDHPGSIDAAFRTVCARAGLEGVTPHTLRHTRATHLLQDGKDPWAVAGLLGDTIQTVMSTYGHHSPEHLRAALA